MLMPFGAIAIVLVVAGLYFIEKRRKPVSIQTRTKITSCERPLNLPNVSPENPNILMKDDIFYLQNNTSPQLYHIFKNIYTYTEAEEECKRRNAKLASKDDLVKAFDTGADWCSYGWVKGKEAYVPNRNPKCLPKIGLLSAGNIPETTKIGANCYGAAPVDVMKA
jgi:hypothetical protein